MIYRNDPNLDPLLPHDGEFKVEEAAFYANLFHHPNYRGLKFVVTAVHRVQNDTLETRFSEAKASREATHETTAVVAGYHGTGSDSVKYITRSNFRLPTSGKPTRTDGWFGSAWFGLGVYFSSHPDYCIKYCVAPGERIGIGFAGRVVRADLLPGRVYTMDSVNEGCPLEPGYDSHTSPSGYELVLFDTSRILPRYVVSFRVEQPIGVHFLAAPERIWVSLPQAIRPIVAFVLSSRVAIQALIIGGAFLVAHFWL